MLRAFVAIELPEPVRQICRDIGDRLRGLKLDGRFVKPESIHLTLKFLGDIDDERVQEIGEILRSSAGKFATFQLRVQGLGVFPHLRRPRVVWVGVQTNDALMGLQRELEERLEEIGFAKEERNFSPHLTLLRLKSQKNVPELVRFLQSDAGTDAIGEIPVDTIHLYQSTLKPTGAEYRKLVTAQLILL